MFPKTGGIIIASEIHQEMNRKIFLQLKEKFCLLAHQGSFIAHIGKGISALLLETDSQRSARRISRRINTTQWVALSSAGDESFREEQFFGCS